MLSWVPAERSVLFRRALAALHAAVVSLAVVVPAFAADPTSAVKTAPATTIWKVDNLKQIGGQTPTLEGAPKIERDAAGVPSVVFNGKTDGLELPVNPLTGLAQFTVEILFSPATDGMAEQRFFHTQDDGGRRALIELRLNSEGMWWLDTYLKPAVAPGLPLIDPKKTHPAGRWYWAALRYDGKQMSSFVNGEKELEGEVSCEPMGPGQTSLGVRLNRVSWFKGAIREVRIHPTALAPEKLQKP